MKINHVRHWMPKPGGRAWQTTNDIIWKKLADVAVIVPGQSSVVAPDLPVLPVIGRFRIVHCVVAQENHFVFKLHGVRVTDTSRPLLRAIYDDNHVAPRFPLVGASPHDDVVRALVERFDIESFPDFSAK